MYRKYNPKVQITKSYNEKEIDKVGKSLTNSCQQSGLSKENRNYLDYLANVKKGDGFKMIN